MDAESEARKVVSDRVRASIIAGGVMAIVVVVAVLVGVFKRMSGEGATQDQPQNIEQSRPADKGDHGGS